MKVILKPFDFSIQSFTALTKGTECGTTYRTEICPPLTQLVRLNVTGTLNLNVTNGVKVNRFAVDAMSLSPR